MVGKVSAELIAEEHGEPELIHKWFNEHIRYRRARNAADIERGKASGEPLAQTDPELLIDSGRAGHRFASRPTAWFVLNFVWCRITRKHSYREGFPKETLLPYWLLPGEVHDFVLRSCSF